MKKSVILIVLSLALVVGLFSGCNTTPNGETGDNNEKITITIANWPKENDQKQRDLYDGYVKTMNEKYPNIEIVPDMWSYDLNSFLPKAASGQLPTMYNTFFTEPAKIVDAGYAKDITNVIKKYGYDKEFNPQYLDLVTFDNKYYGYPYTSYTLGLMCNVKIFKDAGLTDENGVPKFPQTFEELAVTAQTIKEKTGKAGFYISTTNNNGGWHFMNIAWAYGVEFVKNEDGKWKSVFNTPECVRAVQLVKDLKWKYNAIQEDILGDANTFMRSVATDQSAMGFSASGDFGHYINNYKMDKNNIALGRMPGGPASRTALMGGVLQMFSPDATDEEIDACFKWLDVQGYTPAISEETKQKWEDNYKYVNERGFVVGCESVPIWINPQWKAEKQAIMDKYVNVDLNMFNDYMGMEDVTIRPEPPVAAQELYKIFDSVIQQVLTDKNADPATIIEKASNDYQSTYLNNIN